MSSLVSLAHCKHLVIWHRARKKYDFDASTKRFVNIQKIRIVLAKIPLVAATAVIDVVAVLF